MTIYNHKYSIKVKKTQIKAWSNEPLENFFSPKLQEESPAQRTRRFTVFPNKLLIAPQRYFRSSEWVNEEYRIGMSVNDQLDLTWLKMTDDIQSELEKTIVIF